MSVTATIYLTAAGCFVGAALLTLFMLWLAARADDNLVEIPTFDEHVDTLPVPVRPWQMYLNDREVDVLRRSVVAAVEPGEQQ